MLACIQIISNPNCNVVFILHVSYGLIGNPSMYAYWIFIFASLLNLLLPSIEFCNININFKINDNTGYSVHA